MITSNPAGTYKLPGKGRIAEGSDADIVLLNPADMSIRTVIALGQVMVKDREVMVKGTFE